MHTEFQRRIVPTIEFAPVRAEDANLQGVGACRQICGNGPRKAKGLLLAGQLLVVFPVDPGACARCVVDLEVYQTSCSAACCHGGSELD